MKDRIAGVEEMKALIRESMLKMKTISFINDAFSP